MSNDRSVWDVVQSCFATIFACSWVAVHPNIPASEDSEVEVVARRLAIMGYMLLAPEMVVMWVARQYLASLEISRRHRDKGWTQVHAFFLLMGGFVLYENGKPLRVLEIQEFEALLEQDRIDWPSVKEREISDKSKGDYFSKGVVIIQTGWFIAQCIARGAKRLAITELEVVTLAFSMITMIVYGLWWRKPLDVKVQVPIHLKQPRLLVEKAVGDDAPFQSLLGSNDDEESGQIHEVALKSTTGTIIEIGSPMSKESPHIGPTISKTQTDTQSNLHNHVDQQHPHGHGILSELKSKFLSLLYRQQEKHGVLRGTLAVIFVFPFLPFFGAFKDMISCTSLEGKHFRVPTFYAPESKNDAWATFLGFLVALVFGGIHCIAWSFNFPTSTERWTWRVSSVVVSGTPAIIVIFSVLAAGDDEEKKSKITDALENVSVAVTMASTCVYIISRLSLLILPLIELRSLPPDSFISFDWASIFPHI